MCKHLCSVVKTKRAALILLGVLARSGYRRYESTTLFSKGNVAGSGFGFNLRSNRTVCFFEIIRWDISSPRALLGSRTGGAETPPAQSVNLLSLLKRHCSARMSVQGQVKESCPNDAGSGCPGFWLPSLCVWSQGSRRRPLLLPGNLYCKMFSFKKKTLLTLL